MIVSHPSRKCGKDSLISRAKEKAREIMAESRKERQIRGTTNTHQKAFMPLFHRDQFIPPKPGKETGLEIGMSQKSKAPPRTKVRGIYSRLVVRLLFSHSLHSRFRCCFLARSLVRAKNSKQKHVFSRFYVPYDIESYFSLE